MLEAYEMWLDGDNFLGIAVAESKERALEITPSYFKNSISARKTNRPINRSEGCFVKIDYLEEDTIKSMGYRSRDALALGIWWE